MSSQLSLISNFISAYNSFSIDEMLSSVHPDIHFKNISNDVVNVATSGKDEFEKLARQSAGLFSEREQKIISVTESGSKVFVEIKYTAVLAVDFPDGPKAGERIEMNGKSEYEFKDGLIFSITDES